MGEYLGVIDDTFVGVEVFDGADTFEPDSA